LIVSASVAGTACVVGAFGAALTDSVPTWRVVGTMIVFVILSRTMSLQLRIGSSSAAIDWGDAALVYGLVELDLPWVVLATAIGAVCVFAMRLERVKATYNIAAAVISTSLACLVLADGRSAARPAQRHRCSGAHPRRRHLHRRC